MAQFSVYSRYTKFCVSTLKSSLEKVFQIGLPLKELFNGCEIGELQKSERSFYLKKIIGERLEHSDLVEKLYTRLIIAKAMANHKIEKDTRSLKYNIELLNFVL